MHAKKKKLPESYADFKPLDVDQSVRVFGAMGDELRRLAPMYISTHEVDVPKEFFRNNHGSLWNAVVSQWFFRGLPPNCEFIPKDGIDPTKAYTHVGAILRSWEPGHTEKEALCAYLLSLWFQDFQPGADAPVEFVQVIDRIKVKS